MPIPPGGVTREEFRLWLWEKKQEKLLGENWREILDNRTKIKEFLFHCNQIHQDVFDGFIKLEKLVKKLELNTPPPSKKE